MVAWYSRSSYPCPPPQCQNPEFATAPWVRGPTPGQLAAGVRLLRHPLLGRRHTAGSGIMASELDDSSDNFQLINEGHLRRLFENDHGSQEQGRSQTSEKPECAAGKRRQTDLGYPSPVSSFSGFFGISLNPLERPIPPSPSAMGMDALRIL